jgi:hypothetical protein
VVLDGSVVDVLLGITEVDAEHLARAAVALQEALDLRPGQPGAEGHAQGTQLRVAVDHGPLDG